MFDFYFGPKPTTLDDEVMYLTSVKRTLPRWCNSIPDAEFGAICEILHHVGAESAAAARPLVLVETGSGASTLALAYYAMKHAGVAYSWDMNGAKVSVIRSACTETFGAIFEAGVPRHLKAVAYHSLSPYAGLPILRDLTDHIDFAFHDSEHVSDTLTAELDRSCPSAPLLASTTRIMLSDIPTRRTSTSYVRNWACRRFRRSPVTIPIHSMCTLSGNCGRHGGRSSRFMGRTATAAKMTSRSPITGAS